MKPLLSIAALLAAAAAFSAGGTGSAAAAECTGPFRQCAIEVGAQCSRDPDGKQRMTYWDHPGYTARFENCVGRIFEANGQPNPYKTGTTGSAGRHGGPALQVPYTELLYPLVDP
jgi:hypothetical protein